MVILIGGAGHTGKTLLAQNLLEKYKINYLSIDHLKMGLIRSGNTSLTPEDDAELVPYLWNIVKEIIKTVIENGQNLVVECCYIPFDWRKSFESRYLKEIDYYCLIMSERYIKNNFEKICTNADVIERRAADSCNEEDMLAENAANLRLCREYGCKYILIDGNYDAVQIAAQIKML